MSKTEPGNGEQKDVRNGAETSAPILPVAPPLPMGAQQAPLVQIANQIMQKSGGLNEFSPEIQRMLIEGLQQQDKFNFDLAIRNIEHDEKSEERDVTDRGQARKQLLWLVVGILILGAAVDLILIANGQYVLATQLLTYGGTSIVSALGGFGLGRTKTFGGSPKPD